jgi:hypothetical protein
MRRQFMPVIVAGLVLAATAAHAQSQFPAPLPGGQAAAPAPVNASPFPPVNGAASPFPPVNGAPSAFPSAGAAPVGGVPAGPMGAPMGGPAGGAEPPDCMKTFMPMREETEKRAKLIKAASDRKAPPEEACKLLINFAGAEGKMLKFIEINSRRCGIPPQVGQQLKAGFTNTEKMKNMVCKVAEMRAKGGGGPAAPSLSEALGSTGIPEAQTTKSGGATFDTLSGNALTR